MENKFNKHYFDKVIQTHQKRVFMTAMAIVKNMTDADDITQNVFVSFIESHHKIKNTERIESWLIRNAYRKSCDVLRWKKVRQFFSLSKSNNEISEDSNKSENNALYAQFNRWSNAHLTEKERMSMHFKDAEGMTFSEISNCMDTSESSVKTHYYRAHKKVALWADAQESI